MRAPSWIATAAALTLAGCGSASGDATSTSEPAAVTTTPALTTVTSTPPQNAMWFAEYLAIGDCWNETFDADGEFDYSGVPEIVDCSVPHDNEVFAVWVPEAGEYPREEGFEAIAEEMCDPAYAAFFGIDWRDAGGLDYFWLYPEEEDWAVDAHGMACSAYLRDVEVVGSLAGIGRGARPFDFPEDAPIPADALLIRAGLTEEGDQRASFFETETDPAETFEQITAAVDAVGWTVDAQGEASRTVVLELSHEGVEYTITITTPEEEGEPVSVAFYYPADNA